MKKSKEIAMAFGAPIYLKRRKNIALDVLQ